MRLIAVAVLLAGVLAGADKWSVLRSEPFAVYTNGKEKDAREALALAVQVQHTLSAQFGKELTPAWPITYVLGKGDAHLRLGPGGYLAGAVDAGEAAACLAGAGLRVRELARRDVRGEYPDFRPPGLAYLREVVLLGEKP